MIKIMNRLFVVAIFSLTIAPIANAASSKTTWENTSEYIYPTNIWGSSMDLFLTDVMGVGELQKKWTYDKCGTTVTVTNPETSESVQRSYPCGVIVYVNKGGYAVRNIEVAARGSSHQPTKDPAFNADCMGVEKKLSAEITIGQYDQFVVPASCAYKLSINISGGPKKDKNLWLTPACVIEASTDGTVTSNSWNKIKTSYAPGVKDAARAAGQSLPKDPEDSEGHKCGEQSKAKL